jgi:hypothetical protein
MLAMSLRIIHGVSAPGMKAVRAPYAFERGEPS